ncbi:MAG: FAD-binding oxidoreductase [Bacteroidota bacterium]
MISNWNNYPNVTAEKTNLISPSEIEKRYSNQNFIMRGAGKSYGDASLGDRICSSLEYNKFLFFDKNNGIISAQSGVLLSEILNVVIPKGWFLPVTPGTKYITIGGAVASDVHGKNHHLEGSISRHIASFDLMITTGEVIRCSKTENSDLFHATCGGMGLTGVILNVSLKLKKIESDRITQRQIKAPDLDSLVGYLNEFSSYTYSVAWIDCLKGGKGFGRGIVMLGEHSVQNDLENKPSLNSAPENQLNIPFNFPNFALNNLTVRLFNEFYYQKTYRKDNTFISGYNSFFYPLDGLGNWNRIYGGKGFLQYQFVLPMEGGKEGLVKILGRINRRGLGSFLAVLKIFGEQPEGILSFPMRGYTLALDFPIVRGLFDFLDELDKIVQDFGGRIYLAKDARMKTEMFLNTYPEIENFRSILLKYGVSTKFESLMSKRLSILNSVID